MRHDCTQQAISKQPQCKYSFFAAVARCARSPGIRRQVAAVNGLPPVFPLSVDSAANEDDLVKHSFCCSMLHSLNSLQDENSQPCAPGKRLGNDTSRRFGGLPGSTPGGKLAGPVSARKALGNITNKKTAGQQRDATPFKSTPSGLGPRKTLGDITNVTPAAQKELPKPLPQKQVQNGSAARSRLAKQKSQAEIYADDGVEKLAGKGLQQLEAEREQRDLLDARRRAAYYASLPAKLPTMQQPLDVLPDLASLELEALEPPPSPKATPQSIDDLLQLDSPSSMIPEIASGDLEVLSDVEEDGFGAAMEPNLAMPGSI